MTAVRRYGDAAAFLARAEEWLLRREAEHNLLLGVAAGLRESAAGYEPPIYLATVEEAGALAGCAFRTPPYKLGLTHMSPAGADAVARDVACVYSSLPAVLGPEAASARFAERWAELRGVSVRAGMRQRIYRLEALTEPAVRAAGSGRWAGPPDAEWATQWVVRFAAEAGTGPSDPRRLIDELVGRRALLVWEDEKPVSMAAAVAHTVHGTRVGFVYTPPGRRGRGYATACTAELSRRLLASGRRFCFLYTDLANPTSNAIYRRLGYEPVCDVVDYTFGDPSS